MLSGKVVATVIAVIFVFSIVTAFMLPHEEKKFIRIENVDVKVDRISDDSVDLTFLIKLSATDNLTIKILTYDLKTNILLNETSIPVKGVEVNKTLSFEKDKDYRVKVVLEREGKTLDFRYLNLRYLNTLIPRNKELKVFLKDVDFKVLGVNGDRVKVLVRYYFDSLKDYDVLFHVKAVQYESNVLADEKWVKAKLEGGRTTIVETNVSVIKNYCYLIKLEAWRDDSIVRIWKSVLNLSPTKRVPKEAVEKEVEFEVEKFVATPTPIKAYGGGEMGIPGRLGVASAGKATPGFEIFALILAGGVALCLRRLGRL